MSDKSFLEEIMKARKTRRKWFYVKTAAAFVFVLLASYSGFGLLNNKSTSRDQPVISDTVTAQLSQSAQAETEVISSKEKSKKSPSPTASNLPPESEVNELALNAELCKQIVNNIKEADDNIANSYFDAWEEWNEFYKGRHDTNEAQEDRAWKKNYFKKQYNSLINSYKESYAKLCGSGGSVSSIVYQPDYAQW